MDDIMNEEELIYDSPYPAYGPEAQAQAAFRREQRDLAGRRAIAGAYRNPGGGRKTKSFAMRRPAGWNAERMAANFRNPAWRAVHLQGKRITLNQFLASKAVASNMRYSTSKGKIKYHISATAKGLLRTRALRERYWPYLAAAIPRGAKSITDIDAINALTAAQDAKSEKASSRMKAIQRARGNYGGGQNTVKRERHWAKSEVKQERF